MATETAAQTHLQSANALVHAGDNLKAVEEFQRALEAKEIDPQNAVAWNDWGVALYLLGRFPEAVEKLREAQKINPDYPEAFSNMGAALAAQKEYEQAIVNYRRATEIKPDYSSAYFNWGNSLYRLKRYEEAVAQYQRATQEDPNNGGAFGGLGLALFYLGRYEEAIVQFKRAAEFKENAADAHNNWGLALHRQKRYREAEDHYRQAVAIKPDNATTFNNWGDALSEDGQSKEAVERYLEAMRLDAVSAKLDKLVAGLDRVSSEDRDQLTGRLRALVDGLENEKRAAAYSSWGNALYGMRRYTEAIPKYERAIGIRENFYDYLNWAVALCLLKKYSNAISRFRSAELHQDPANPAATAALYSEWGNAHLSLKQYADAARQYEKATQDVPGASMEPDALEDFRRTQAGAYFGWGNALASQRRYEGAIAKQRRATELVRDYAYAHHNLASYLWFQGKFKEGWEEWRHARDAYERSKAKALESQDSDLFQYYGTLLHKIFRRFDDAEAIFEEGLKLKPDHIGIRIGKISLYLAQRDNVPDATGVYWKAREAYVEARRLLADQLKETKQPDFYLQKGELELLMGDYEEAEKDLVKARELDPEGDSPDVCINLGVLWMQKENYERAVQYFEEACRREPDNLKARACLAGAHLKAKPVEKAESEYQNLLAVAPQHVESRIGLGEVYTAMGEDGDPDLYQEAIENFDEALALSAGGEASEVLHGKELAAVYYSRGYARVRLFQASQSKEGGLGLNRWSKKKEIIDNARNDFQSCLNECKKAGCTAGVPELLGAKRALSKLKQESSRSRAEVLERVGPWVLVVLSLALLAVTQYSFFRGGRLSDPKYYVALTFGSLMFMLAALCLPQLSKFKISGVSLEKVPAEKATEVAVVKISRGGGISPNPTLSFFSADRYAEVRPESEKGEQVKGGAEV